MWHILEAAIIVLAGLISAAFLAGYFFISPKTRKKAGCGGGCGGGCAGGRDIDKKEIFSKILKNDKKLNRKV